MKAYNISRSNSEAYMLGKKTIPDPSEIKHRGHPHISGVPTWPPPNPCRLENSMSNTDDEGIEVVFDKVIARTTLAILFDFGGRQHWIPTAKIMDYTDELLDSEEPFEGSGSIWIPEWIAIERGLV